MRLPQIRYTTPVQSMGRYDVTLPIKTAGATAKAVMETTGAVESWAKAEDAKNVAINTAEFNQRAEDLMNDLLQQEVINLDEHDVDLGIDDTKIKTISVQGEDGQQKEIRTAPKYLVLAPLYDHYVSQLREEFSHRQMTPDGKAQFDLDTGAMLHKANLKISSEQFASWHEHMNVEFTNAHTQFIMQGNVEGAQKTADAAVAAGVWSLETHMEKTVNLQNDIAVYNAQVALTSEDPDYLSDYSTRVLFDPNLLPKQAAAFSQEALTKSYAMEKRRTEEEKRIKKENSEKGLIDNMAMIMERRQPMDDDELARTIRTLEATEAKSLRSFNSTYRSELKQGTKSFDADVYEEIKASAVQLAFPEAGDMPERKNNVLQRATEAHENGEILSDHLWEIRQLANDAIAEPMKDPELIYVIDDVIWPELTGGSRTGIVMNNRAPQILNATRAVNKLREAFKRNPGLDPHQWWAENRARYGGGGLKANEATAKTQRQNAVLNRYGYGSGAGLVDTEGLKMHLRQKKAEGYYDEDEVIDINNKAIQHNKELRLKNNSPQ